METWGLAFREFQYRDIYGKSRPFDYLWECHGKDTPFPDEYREWLKGQDNIRYPDTISCRELCGPEGIKSSLAYMLLQAILLRPEKIHLYGFDVMGIKAEEYYDQVPNLKYIVGLAIGRGIEVTCPPQSGFFETDIYGGLNG